MGASVAVTPEVTLGFAPWTLLVTLKVTVQLLEAGIVIPEKLSAVAPATNVAGVVPTQVPPTAPPVALILTSVSVNDPFVRGIALLFASVRVTTEFPPAGIVVGLNAFEIVAETVGSPGPGDQVPLFVTPAGGVGQSPASLSCVRTVWSTAGENAVDIV